MALEGRACSRALLPADFSRSLRADSTRSLRAGSESRLAGLRASRLADSAGSAAQVALAALGEPPEAKVELVAAVA